MTCEVDSPPVWGLVCSPEEVTPGQRGYLAPTRVDLRGFLAFDPDIANVVAVLCLTDNFGVLQVRMASVALRSNPDFMPVEAWLATVLPTLAPEFPPCGVADGPLPLVMTMADPYEGPGLGWDWVVAHRWDEFVAVTVQNEGDPAHPWDRKETNSAKDEFPDSDFRIAIDWIGNPDDPGGHSQLPIKVAEHRAYALAWLREARSELVEGRCSKHTTARAQQFWWEADKVVDAEWFVARQADCMLGPAMGGPLMTLERALTYKAAGVPALEARELEFGTPGGPDREDLLAMLCALRGR